MASRDPQTVVLSRQAILLVTAVGVGLLTLCYVLGVQVGKQSAALRRPLSKGAGEELEELPATMVDQLKALDQPGTGFEKVQKAPADAKGEKPAEPKADKPQASEPAPKAEPAPKPSEAPGHWAIQLVSTPDGAEAKTVLAKARASGYTAETITEKGLHKVRLTTPMKRDAADTAIQKLRNRGFKPFAIKVD
jgi:cell division septation protein DedD